LGWKDTTSGTSEKTRRGSKPFSSGIRKKEAEPHRRSKAAGLFREASKILTLYYDPDTYHQICPWHHAAGDFVVNLSEGIVQVKLTAARNYLPLISFPGRAGTNRVTAFVAFLLNMTVQMRLDRIGGVGEPIWAQEKL